MKIEGFVATADLVGRRIWISWTFVPDAGETVADIPQVTIRRKERDFAFPPAVPGDPYLVYDSVGFPPAPIPGALVVRDLPDYDTRRGAERIREQTITVAEVVGGQSREILRRVLRTTFSADRRATRVDVELLDVGGVGVHLSPGVVYYYEFDSPILGSATDRSSYRATVVPGEAHGMNRVLYELIPEVYRRHDTVTRAADAATPHLPEANVSGGQLKRFVDVFGMATDSMRSSADSLWTLHDPAVSDPRFLPGIADWIGWELSPADDLPRQRNEIGNAPRLYRSVGTIPGLRTIVGHYTGWSTRVAEFVQQIARTNEPRLHNVFGIVRDAGTWWGVDDAAPELGFAPPNDEALGGGPMPAVLTGTTVEPFSLRTGMTLTIAVDGGLPATITFGARDFADIASATAAEVAAVIDKTMDEATAVAAGSVRLISHREGDASQVTVHAAHASLVSVDAAPGGRLATAIDVDGRLWVVYATATVAGGGSRLLYKPYFRGVWRDAQPVPERGAGRQADPACVALPGGDLWLAWIEGPDTDRARIRWSRGVPRPLTPARILGETTEPFALTAGTQLVFTGYGAPETFVVQAADYAAIGSAMAAEVAAALNAQLAGITAAVAPNGALSIRTAATGPGVSVRVDLRSSNTARALGFGDRSLVGRGGWDAQVDWGRVGGIEALHATRLADCMATVDPEGAVRLFWSTHRAGRWKIARTRWDDRVSAATPGGVGIRLPNGTWLALTAADGLPSNDVRDLAVDADGSTWYATGSGGAVRRPDGIITVLSNATTAGGLADDDVRAVAVAEEGTVWFAHASGASTRGAAGVWSTVTAVDGLANDDCRHVVVAPDANVWFATAAGVSRLSPDGRWRSWTSGDGLPSSDVRALSRGADGSMWAATSAGLARITPGGSVETASLVTAGAGPGTDDIRGLASDPESEDAFPLWAATGQGVVEVRSPRHVTAFGLADGLPSATCRDVLVAGDGTVWVATSTGLARREPGASTWTAMTTTDGLVSDDCRALQGPWSSSLEFDAAGAGDRDPHAVLDGAGRIWLTWAERANVGDEGDTWLIRLRRFVWPGPDWSPPLSVTTVPASGRVTDREPSAVPAAAGGGTVYLRSDRGGGPRLWTVDLDSADAASAPAIVTTDEAADSNPAAVRLPTGADWVLFRSDRGVPLGRLGGGIPDAGDAAAVASRRAPEEASIRRFAGTTTVLLNDLDRNRTRRRFGDMLSYTPQRPRGLVEGPVEPDELYTRGTIGLYIERGPAGAPLTRRDAERLRQLLARLLPANLRAVVILRPSALLVEAVYPPGPLDNYEDVYPIVDAYDGPSDSWAAAVPDWLVFLSTDAASITVDPGDLTTLRRRTWWPPVQ